MIAMATGQDTPLISTTVQARLAPDTLSSTQSSLVMSLTVTAPSTGVSATVRQSMMARSRAVMVPGCSASRYRI
jgi:hypothetical protein